MPVVMPTIQTVQKTVEVPQIRCLGRVVDVLVVTQTGANEQRTVEIPQAPAIH